MADATVETTGFGHGLVVRVSGEMDHDSELWFRAHFTELVAHDERFIVLDLSGVSFCDSAGLNVLLGVWRQAEASGVGLVLACVPAPLRRIFQMTGTDQVLRVSDTVTDARAIFGG
ncbi:STAS domain-containing protein [Streptomyces sp. NPDC048384]|uniref:STAS domain-containing protein n=1 Tax=Streptomyces sp. NPDC048384 TaxID=3155487 RepID=UPI0034286498